MSGRPETPTGEGWVRRVLALAPARFESRHADDLIECHRDAWADSEARGPLGRVRFAVMSVITTTGVVVKQWMSVLREVEMGGGRWVQELRHATRRLVRRPGFSAAVILTLGLGLGANTAVFTVLQSVLLAPLPYESSEQLVRIYQMSHTRAELNEMYLPTPALLDLRDQIPALSSVAALYNSSTRSVDITDGDRPERLRQLEVNAEYFRTLGVSPTAGRFFDQTEEIPDIRTAVVTERVWQQYMGGRIDALGGTLALDGDAVQIVGVVSDDFRDPLEGRIDVFTPLDLTGVAYWNSNWLTAYGRLEPDATPELLREQLDALESRYAEMFGAQMQTGFRAVPLQRDIVGESSTLLFAVAGAVLFLLLLTAVNVASLLTSRAASRERELAIRQSLGSPRSSVFRDFMLESFLLSAVGGAAGLVIGVWALRLILTVAPAGLPRLESIGPGTHSIAFAALGAVVLGCALGLATALPFSRPRMWAVTSGTRGDGGASSGRRARSALVRIEVALAVVLLAGAGVLTRTLQALTSQDLGPEPAGVLTFEVGLPSARYADDAAIAEFHRTFQDRVAQIPGVRSAGSTSRLPVTGSFNTWGMRRAYGPEEPFDGPNTSVNQRWIAGDYFETVGLDLVAGRSFDATDEAGMETHSTVVNEAFVRALFGDENPLGAWVSTGGRYSRIVGVVEDAWLTARTPPAPTAYHHTRQWIGASRILTQVVRVDDDPVRYLTELRTALADVDPNLVLYRPVPMDAVMGRSVETERFGATLLGAFAALALIVAGLGLYGVLAHFVGRQRHEIGVRMALGAGRRGVLLMVMGRGLWLAGTGLAVGLALALILGRSLDALVYGVSARDPLVLVAAPAVLLVVALAASCIPALRAVRVHPVEAFRTE